jgi:hypothetical protein
MQQITFLGEVHLDHDKIPSRQLHHFGVMKGDVVQLPARGAPGGQSRAHISITIYILILFAVKAKRAVPNGHFVYPA